MWNSTQLSDTSVRTARVEDPGLSSARQAAEAMPGKRQLLAEINGISTLLILKGRAFYPVFLKRSSIAQIYCFFTTFQPQIRYNRL